MKAFARERIAIKFCEQRNIADDDPMRAAIIDAFVSGFDIANQRLRRLIKEIYRQDHTYLSVVADNIDKELDEI